MGSDSFDFAPLLLYDALSDIGWHQIDSMARLPRFVLPGHPQHVIVRGNNREPVFYADDDYRFYLQIAETGMRQTPV